MKLNLLSGYWKIKMEDSCKEMMTNVTRSGTYQFEIILFGLINAPATFQRMMHKFLHCIQFSMAYFNDVVGLSKSIHGYLQYLEKIFLLLGKQKSKLKLSKCELAKSSLELLGHIVGFKGISEGGRHTGCCYTSKSFVIKNFSGTLWILQPIY